MTKTQKLGWFFYILFIISSIIYIHLELDNSYYFGVVERLLFILGGTIFLYLGSFCQCYKLSSYKQKSIMQVTFRLMFIFYMILIITYTLFDPILGRSVSFPDIQEILNYLKQHSNFIPLKTILLYIRGLQNNLVSLDTFIMNLLGNIVAISPLSFFLPLFNKNLRKNFLQLFFRLVLFVIFIEILQGILMCGAVDIDDLILNVVGAILIYVILWNKKVIPLIKRITFNAFE